MTQQARDVFVKGVVVTFFTAMGTVVGFAGGLYLGFLIF
jgi:hypothetical protein